MACEGTNDLVMSAHLASEKLDTLGESPELEGVPKSDEPPPRIQRLLDEIEGPPSASPRQQYRSYRDR